MDGRALEQVPRCGVSFPEIFSPSWVGAVWPALGDPTGAGLGLVPSRGPFQPQPQSQFQPQPGILWDSGSPQLWGSRSRAEISHRNDLSKAGCYQLLCAVLINNQLLVTQSNHEAEAAQMNRIPIAPEEMRLRTHSQRREWLRFSSSPTAALHLMAHWVPNQSRYLRCPVVNSEKKKKKKLI